MVSRMNCDTEVGQALLRKCGLIQSRFRVNFSVHRIARSTGTTPACDVHTATHVVDIMQTRHDWPSSARQHHSSSGPQWQRAHWDCTQEISATGRSSANSLASQCGLTSCPGHSKREWSDYTPVCVPQRDTTRTMSETSTRPSTKRWQQLSSPTKPFGTPSSTTVSLELVAQDYKRTNSQVERKQPVTTPMLLKVRERLVRPSSEDRLLWGSILLAFFFLDRSELWGPVVHDKSTGAEQAHCVKAHNVILRDRHVRQIQPTESGAHSVEILFESHKGDRIGQGVSIRHYVPEHQELRPVAAAQECLCIRSQWITEGKKLGPYLTSVSTTKTIRKATVADTIKNTAEAMDLARKDYSPHSLRIGGACALLTAGKSDLVIRLMGRLSSWCFSLYTRLRPGMVRDAASCMIKASTWAVFIINKLETQ